MDSRTYYERNTTNSPILEDQDEVNQHLLARHASVVCRRLGSIAGKTILDVGCGDGYLMSRLADRDADVHGTDIALARLQQARERLGLPADASNLFQASAQVIPRGDETFDIVTCSEVLEHLADPLPAVREAHRLIRPDGTYLLTVPYKERILQNLCVHCGQMTPQYGHLHSFSGPDVQALLLDAGFIDVRWEPFVSPNNKRAFVRSILARTPDWLWLGIDRWLCATFDQGVWLLAVARRP